MSDVSASEPSPQKVIRATSARHRTFPGTGISWIPHGQDTGVPVNLTMITDSPAPLPDGVRPSPHHHEIVARARQLWEHYGRPEHQDLKIWLEAERQVLGSDTPASPQSGGAVPADPLQDTQYPFTNREGDRAEEPAPLPPGNLEASGGRTPA